MNVSAPVFAAIGSLGVVPIVLAAEPSQSDALCMALKSGGLACVEVTFRTAGAEESLRRMAADPDMLVGAGTVLTCAQAERAVAAGAQFIVSPGLSLELVRHCLQIHVPVIPGVATASEIQAAWSMGLEVVKFFPAEPLGGIRTLSALAGPFPGMRFVPTGGIRGDLIGSYLSNDAVLAVGGSWMVAQAMTTEGRWEEVTRQAAEAVAAARAVRVEVGGAALG
jgi:2-dehydro-3-deoxyphosphogluconate aldolase/(4S)-4-hydroxy-2-oxoglutarate aldolase